ncbi:MAG: ABC transporter permease [Chloroflexota bacterium]|nr:ABC transporter permease [Chloroflexota bacterium]
MIPPFSRRRPGSRGGADCPEPVEGSRAGGNPETSQTRRSRAGGNPAGRGEGRPFALSLSKGLPAAAVALAIAAALLAGVLAPADPLAQDTARRLEAPSGDYLLGSDNFGRDVLSRVLHGARTALAIGVGGVAAGATVGAAVGLASAYRGGWLDLAVQRVVDALLGFPLLALAVVIVVSLGVSTGAVTTAIAVALAPQAARLARSSALTVRTSGYVAAAVTIGASPTRVLLRHVLPHSLGPVLVYATGFVATALATEAALSYLGLGAPPPTPSWGGMLNEGREFLETAPWLTLAPAAALATTAAAFALLGDALGTRRTP